MNIEQSALQTVFEMREVLYAHCLTSYFLVLWLEHQHHYAHSRCRLRSNHCFQDYSPSVFVKVKPDTEVVTEEWMRTLGLENQHLKTEACRPSVGIFGWGDGWWVAGGELTGIWEACYHYVVSTVTID